MQPLAFYLIEEDENSFNLNYLGVDTIRKQLSIGILIISMSSLSLCYWYFVKHFNADGQHKIPRYTDFM